MSRSADNQAAVEQTVARWGRLDIFYANAGVPERPTPVEDVDEATFDRIMAVNVKGPFLGAKYAAPVMKRQRSGVFLITGSTSAVRPRPGVQCYSASKGAVHVLAKSLALELAPFGVRVVAIAPVATETPMLPGVHGQGQGGRRRDGPIPQHRAAGPAQPARGPRAGGALPGLGRRGDDHGHDARGGWRPMHLSPAPVHLSKD